MLTGEVSGRKMDGRRKKWSNKSTDRNSDTVMQWSNDNKCSQTIQRQDIYSVVKSDVFTIHLESSYSSFKFVRYMILCLRVFVKLFITNASSTCVWTWTKDNHDLTYHDKSNVYMVTNFIYIYILCLWSYILKIDHFWK